MGYMSDNHELIEILELAERRQRLLELKNQFIQNVSHELRTPLAIMMGYAGLLNQGQLGELTEEQAGAIDIIWRRAKSLQRMMNDIITTLELEQLKGHIVDEFKPVNVSDVVRMMIEDHRLFASQKGVSLKFGVGEGCDRVIVNGDAQMVQQAVDNVVRNAIKFTSAGGLVDIGVWCEPGYCVVCVVDTGIGIAQEKIDAIFQRFYQVNGSDTRLFGGVGLGLAVVKDIVEAHGGHIEVQSKVGQGSRFDLYFPLMEEAT
jgi:signal transduction histidine kinase